MARSRPRGRNGGVVLGVATVAAAFFSIPFAAHYAKRDNLHTTPKALNATQVRRGAYLNTGSKDAGADPDWDTDSHTYRGRERRRQQQLRQREKEAGAQRDDE